MISFKDYFSESKKTWCAVVLDEPSVDLLKKTFAKQIHKMEQQAGKRKWTIFCNHMTIDMENPLKNKKDLWKEVTLTVMSIASNPEYLAVKVSGYPRQDGDDFSHITIAEIPEQYETKPHLPLTFHPFERHLAVTGKIVNISENRRFI